MSIVPQRRNGLCLLRGERGDVLLHFIDHLECGLVLGFDGALWAQLLRVLEQGVHG